MSAALPSKTDETAVSITKSSTRSIIGVVVYLVVLLAGSIVAIAYVQLFPTPEWIQKARLLLVCSFLGGIGGEFYCLRGVYLNTSVRKSWDTGWLPWYFIRPIVSHLSGAISYLFLKAGLLLLDAKPQSTDASNYGFLALAFIAGMNVDKFTLKLEELAQAAWGIEKSRTAKRDDEKK